MTQVDTTKIINIKPWNVLSGFYIAYREDMLLCTRLLDECPYIESLHLESSPLSLSQKLETRGFAGLTFEAIDIDPLSEPLKSVYLYESIEHRWERDTMQERMISVFLLHTRSAIVNIDRWV